MRYFTSALVVCSGFMVAAAGLSGLSGEAIAAQVLPTDHRVAVLGTEAQGVTEPKLREVCSRNRPLSVSADGTKLAANPTSQGMNLASSVVQMFCRDVRINTIVVRDYCAIIRE